ncbi:MAG: hypothetical protein B7Y61_14440 [Rhizobiales bacterium 35-66-30]|nr:MAG: hypothetical protein B7Y61_14440 [Rhizobiales bacterium 35-66-30]
MDETTRAAFERLLTITRSDTGQSRRVAGFILAWWNAIDLGSFDIADLFAVDEAIAHDMATVFAYVAGRPVAEYQPKRCDARSGLSPTVRLLAADPRLSCIRPLSTISTITA